MALDRDIDRRPAGGKPSAAAAWPGARQDGGACIARRRRCHPPARARPITRPVSQRNRRSALRLADDRAQWRARRRRARGGGPRCTRRVVCGPRQRGRRALPQRLAAAAVGGGGRGQPAASERDRRPVLQRRARLARCDRQRARSGPQRQCAPAAAALIPAFRALRPPRLERGSDPRGGIVVFRRR